MLKEHDDPADEDRERADDNNWSDGTTGDGEVAKLGKHVGEASTR